MRLMPRSGQSLAPFSMEYSNTPKAMILGQVIKEYRLEQTFTRERLAYRLGIDVKTVLNWERGQVTSIQLRNKRNLHEVLGIPLRILGLPEQLSKEKALDLQKRICSFLERGAYVSVQEISDLLIQEYTESESRILSGMQSILTHAFYTKGLATAILTDKPQEALKLYKRMENIATEADDINGLSLARTYQGDMYRRIGRYDIAQELLEEVIDQSKESRRNALVIGNCYQLLGRVYLAQKHEEKALAALDKAEKLARFITPEHETGWYIPFCLCSVKEELTKSLMVLRQYERSLKALKELEGLAQQAAKRWAIPSTITRGELLVRFARQNDDDQSYYEQGIESLSKGYKLAKEHNHLRQQQRVERLLTMWERSDGLRLDYSQKLRGKIRKIDAEGNDG